MPRKERAAVTGLGLAAETSGSLFTGIGVCGKVNGDQLRAAASLPSFVDAGKLPFCDYAAKLNMST